MTQETYWEFPLKLGLHLAVGSLIGADCNPNGGKDDGFSGMNRKLKSLSPSLVGEVQTLKPLLYLTETAGG